jgi:hypothetical protein
MSAHHRSQSPLAGRALLRLASLMVPQEGRDTWRRQQDATLQSLWILAERGELPGNTTAFLTCCRGLDPRRWSRGPAFLMAVSAFALLLIAGFTHGFAVTRSLVHALGGPPGNLKEDRLVANLFPIAFALAVSVKAAVGRLSLAGHGWRYRSFLLLKTLLLATIVPLLWIEGGAALRRAIPNQTLRVLGGGLALTAVFVMTFGWAVMWSLDDQRRRCPVCLQRLTMPVRIGSCASVFEPATTEWICETCHGSLCVCDVESGERDRWLELAYAPAEYAARKT